MNTDARYKNHRIRAFTILWFVYGGYYLTRNCYFVAKPMLAEKLHYTNTQLGWIDLAYLSIYAVGQFINGVLGDRLNPKIMLGAGMLLSSLMACLFGIAHGFIYFIIFWAINGYAQSTGWTLCVKSMSQWFSPRERGTIMGLYSTSYQLGSFLTRALATVLLVWVGWRFTFIIPASILAVIAIIYLIFHKNTPEEVGLPPIEEYHAMNKDEAGTADNVKPVQVITEPTSNEVLRKVLREKTVWIMGLSYFCLKFTRYAFMGWLAKYLYDTLNMKASTAGWYSTVPELAGFFGAIFAGYVSDKYLGARRGPVAAMMLFGLAVACMVQGYFAQAGPYWNLFGLCIIYFMIYGPDSIVTGAGAMDFGSKRGAATAAGIINGIGSVGAAVQGPLLGHIADKYGWGSFYYIFIGLSVVSGLLMATRWNVRPTSEA